MNALNSVPDYIISAPVITLLLNSFQLTTLHYNVHFHGIFLSISFLLYILLLAVAIGISLYRPLAHHYIILISLPMQLREYIFVCAIKH